MAMEGNLRFFAQPTSLLKRGKGAIVQLNHQELQDGTRGRNQQIQIDRLNREEEGKKKERAYAYLPGNGSDWLLSCLEKEKRLW